MRKRNFKALAFVSVVLVGTGIILGLLLTDYHNSNEGEKIVPADETKADISIGKFHQESTRDGKKEWVLDAESAQMIESEQRLWLQGVSATFITRDGSPIYLSADEGFVDTQTQDVDAVGNVTLKNKDYQLTSEKLIYKNESKMLTSPGPVKIADKNSRLSADRMEFDIETKASTMVGNVVGIFSEQQLF